MNPAPTLDVSAVIDALWQVLPRDRAPIPLHEPEFGAEDRAYVLDCLDSTFVSSVGKYVDRFEQELAEYTGARRAVAVVNGTAALHVALGIAGVQAGDEVLVPAMTFVATANAVRYCNATPHFVDIEERTLGVDANKLDAWLRGCARVSGDECRNRTTGARIAAIVPMHAFGHPVDMDRLMECASRWRLAVVEDAAESLGSRYRGRHTGRLGRMGVLSFNGNKIITTGGGGAVITDDEALAASIKHLTTTAKVSHRWEYAHDAVGFNFRLPNLNAALGCAQMRHLPRFLAQKRELAGRYRTAFAQVEGVRFFDEPPGSQSNFWLNTLLLDEANAPLRDELLEATNAVGIGTRPAWRLMHRLPMYGECPRMDLSAAESLERRLVNIPSSARWGVAGAP